MRKSRVRVSSGEVERRFGFGYDGPGKGKVALQYLETGVSRTTGETGWS